ISTPERIIFHAGTKWQDGKVVTSGGRVLGATALAETLPKAIDAAYRLVGEIDFDNKYYRTDIGQKALKRM
ncbi:MAG TPA: phosphoribosylglycinamide synthetase C domain-containing protein, partial [Candidatus Sumerlaeota bacterium]|nr:phosphoribosylglycinamide synthetase C domain-containing protein [Candidatus Sumerlaeota bacterium]